MQCKIAPGWHEAGREGLLICAFDSQLGQLWCAVKWNDDEDPDCHKAAGLLMKHRSDRHWHPIRI
jgi:hypothetical protein